MRISRRSSGGRGEYELSGETANGLRAVDVVGYRIILDLGNDWIINTDTRLSHQGGKPRFRRIHNTPTHMQVQRQLAAALLMPHPVRQDNNLAGGLPILRADRYAIEHVEISEDVHLADDVAVLPVQEIVLRNMSYHAEVLHFADRRTRLGVVWEHSQELPAGNPCPSESAPGGGSGRRPGSNRDRGLSRRIADPGHGVCGGSRLALSKR